MTNEKPEYVAADDAVIGRVFRWSLAVFGIVGLIALGIVLVRRGGEAPEPIIVDKDPGAITGLETPASMVLPQIPFTDVTASAGIDFVHHNGATGERMLPETMGAGCAFFDYDGDGDTDLLFVNGTHWPWDEAPSGAPTTALYRNDGAGRFENVTRAAGLDDVRLYGQGVACGDFDEDGDVDLYLTAVGTNRLLENDGGTFRDITAEAGVGGDPSTWSTSAGFFDVDGDRDLDLFVCNYVEWSREIDLELNYTLNGTDRAYGPPTDFRGTACTLYLNDGAGRFRAAPDDAGLRVVNTRTGTLVGKALALAPIDVDADGDLDVVVANDTTRNFLFRNRGDGTFEEVGAAMGVAYDGRGRSTGAMGADAAYFRNDDDLAVGIGNFANEMTSFYVRQANSTQFVDEAAVEGVGSPSRQALSFGLFFFDADLDGRLDLLQSNGHLEEEINELQPSQHYRQPAQLFWNAGFENPSTYVGLDAERIGDLATPIVGRGAAYADIDGDGDLDVVLTTTNGPPMLLRNDVETEGHWLRVRLDGGSVLPDAIGARVELTTGNVTQRRLVMPTRSYLSQCELPVTFGLGADATVDRLEVIWPDGSRQVVPVDGVDRELVVRFAPAG